MICTYDNPATMCRECWSNGKIICSYSFKLFYMNREIPAEYFFFGANIGEWVKGQLLGDKGAMVKPPNS